MRRLGAVVLGLAAAVVFGHASGCDSVCASRSQLAPGTFAASSLPAGASGYSLVLDGDFATVHERFTLDGHAHERTWRVPVVHHYDTSY